MRVRFDLRRILKSEGEPCVRLERPRSGGVDIGAVEAHTNFVVTNNSDSGDGSFRQAVNDSDNFAGLDTITFDPNVFSGPLTITLTNGELDITDNFLQFRNTFGLGSADAGFNTNFDSDGDVDAFDFLQFRTRFGTAV